MTPPLPWGKSLALIDGDLLIKEVGIRPVDRVEPKLFPLGIVRVRGTSQLSESSPGIPGIFIIPGIPGIIPPAPGLPMGKPPGPTPPNAVALRPFLMTAVAPGRNPRFFSASEWISEIVFALTYNNKDQHKSLQFFKHVRI
jgi:hypothetical protein